MANVTVKNTAELIAAVKAAKDGDVVSLAPGTYSKVNLRSITTPGNVTIQSLDPAKPAVLTDLSIRDSKGMTFRNLEVALDPATGAQAFHVWTSSNMVFDKLNVHGTLNGNAQDDTAAFGIRDSKNITVTNSEFHELKHGLGIGTSSDVTVTNNNFHDIRIDGIIGAGSQKVLIDGNRFSDFYPIDGDHADAIQFWTTGTTVANTDLTITNNLIVRGKGDPIQGIFLRDQVGTLAFERVNISNNNLVGTGYNGIAVSNAKGLTVNDNAVVSIEGQKSWVRLDGVTQAVSKGNSAAVFLTSGTNDLSTADNRETPLVSEDTARTISTAVLGPKASGAAVAAMIEGIVQPIQARIEATTVVMNGTAGDDKLTATGTRRHQMIGGDGNDWLTGAGGAAEMIGGKGDDNYTIKAANQIVIEEANGGSDTVNAEIDYTLTANVETLRMTKVGLIGRGNELGNRIIGSGGTDTLYGEGGDDTIQAGAGNDIVYGGTGNDTLRGEDGDDTLYGDAGDDKLYGGVGNDILYGGEGNNYLEGGAGADMLYGGSGKDSFVFRPDDFGPDLLASMDTIVGFSSAQKDTIGLSFVDANTNTKADDRFAFIGTKAFTKTAGQLRYEVSGKNSFVMGDTNGDGVADFRIMVAGVTSLTASDFVL